MIKETMSFLKNDKNGHLEDKRGRRVNRRGYLVDKLGNIIDKYGNMIFKERELDSDDEIPPPYSFEKRKKCNFLIESQMKLKIIT